MTVIAWHSFRHQNRYTITWTHLCSCLQHGWFLSPPLSLSLACSQSLAALACIHSLHVGSCLSCCDSPRWCLGSVFTAFIVARASVLPESGDRELRMNNLPSHYLSWPSPDTDQRSKGPRAHNEQAATISLRGFMQKVPGLC